MRTTDVAAGLHVVQIQNSCRRRLIIIEQQASGLEPAWLPVAGGYCCAASGSTSLTHPHPAAAAAARWG